MIDSKYTQYLVVALVAYFGLFLLRRIFLKMRIGNFYDGLDGVATRWHLQPKKTRRGVEVRGTYHERPLRIGIDFKDHLFFLVMTPHEISMTKKPSTSSYRPTKKTILRGKDVSCELPRSEAFNMQGGFLLTLDGIQLLIDELESACVIVEGRRSASVQVFGAKKRA